MIVHRFLQLLGAPKSLLETSRTSNTRITSTPNTASAIVFNTSSPTRCCTATALEDPLVNLYYLMCTNKFKEFQGLKEPTREHFLAARVHCAI